MANVKIYLDRRSTKKDGTNPVKLAVNHQGSTRLISLGVSANPQFWDVDKNEVSAKHPYHRKLNAYIARCRLEAEEALLGMLRGGLSLAELHQRIKAVVMPEAEKPEKLPEDVCSTMRRYASLKKDSTRQTFDRTLAHIRAFAGERVAFEQVTRSWLMEFDAHMAKTAPSPNARAIHMRNLRTVINFAIDDGLTENYPFRKFKIKTVQTAKRNLKAEDLRKVFSYPCEPWQKQYIDFFKLSFLLIGINAKDLLSLKPTDVHDGRVEFNRAKTGRLYSLKLEPEALELIEAYKGERHLISQMDTRTDYCQYIRYCNAALKKLGTECKVGTKTTGVPLFPQISTYWARHSWATIAAYLDVPKATIAAALGHGAQTVTDIYIDYDRDKIDAANRRVIDYVFYNLK